MFISYVDRIDTSQSIATIKLRIPSISWLASPPIPLFTVFFDRFFVFDRRERERGREGRGKGDLFPSRRIRSKLDNKGYQDNLTRISRFETFTSRSPYIYIYIHPVSSLSFEFIRLRKDLEIDGNILANEKDRIFLISVWIWKSSFIVRIMTSRSDFSSNLEV